MTETLLCYVGVPRRELLRIWEGVHITLEKGVLWIILGSGAAFIRQRRKCTKPHREGLGDIPNHSSGQVAVG